MAQLDRATVQDVPKNWKGIAFYAKQGFRETARFIEEVSGTSLENVVLEKAL